MRHEIGISLRTPDIVWVNGGFPAGEHADMKIAREGMFDWLEPGERIIADDGCRGSHKIICPKSGRRDNCLLRKILARHKMINQRAKRYKVLQDVYSGNRAFHCTVTHAIFNLVQVELDSGCLFLPAIKF